MNAQQNSNKGFTIIEVVLVLAIAGLIFLMIFLAWPALQKSQRDTARKNDANVVASALSSYRSNNRGSNPTSAAQITTFRTSFLGELSQYDKTSATEVVIGIGGTAVPAANQFRQMNVNLGTKCNGNVPTTTGASSRQATVTVLIESAAATGVTFCQDA